MADQPRGVISATIFYFLTAGCYSAIPTRIWPLTDSTYGMDITGNADSTGHLLGCTFVANNETTHPYASLLLGGAQFVDIPITAEAVATTEDRGMHKFSLTVYIYKDPITYRDGVLFEYQANGIVYFQLSTARKIPKVVLNMPECSDGGTASQELANGWNHVALVWKVNTNGMITGIYLEDTEILYKLDQCNIYIDIPVPGILRVGASHSNTDYLRGTISCLMLYPLRLRITDMDDNANGKLCAQNMGNWNFTDAGETCTNVRTATTATTTTQLGTTIAIPPTTTIDAISRIAHRTGTIAKGQRSTITGGTRIINPALTTETTTVTSRTMRANQKETTRAFQFRGTYATNQTPTTTNSVDLITTRGGQDQNDMSSPAATVFETSTLTEPSATSVTSDTVDVGLRINSSDTTMVVTSGQGTGPSNVPEECVCQCWETPALAEEESALFMSKLLETIHVKKDSISAYKRKYISVTDERPSARRVGYVGIVVLAAVTGCFVLADFTRLCYEIGRLFGVMKRCFA